MDGNSRSSRRFVYMLYEYGEDGPENLVATTSRAELPTLLQTFNVDGFFKTLDVNPVESMRDALAMDDKDIGIYRLTDGWGGVTLHVAEDQKNS